MQLSSKTILVHLRSHVVKRLRLVAAEMASGQKKEKNLILAILCEKHYVTDTYQRSDPLILDYFT